MKTVFLLQHSYTEGEIENTKIIGIYSSRDMAEKIITTYKNISGFKDYPNDFYIDQYEVDKNEWSEGFINSEESITSIIEASYNDKEK